MKLLLLLAVLSLLPAAAGQPALHGEVTAATVTSGAATPVDGQGAFVGFFQLPDQPAVGWSLHADSLLVDVSTYTFTMITPLVYSPLTPPGPEHATQNYAQATVEPTLSTKPAANAHEFWMMVTPLQSDQQRGFQLTGALATAELQSMDRVFYLNDAAYPAQQENTGPEDGSGVGHVRYASAHPALEWKPGSTDGAWTVGGDFLLTVFQNDFQVTDTSGKTDHYSTGDEDTGFSATNAVDTYKMVRADLTVHGGSLTLHPNGRSLQLDFAQLGATVTGGLDFANAHGSLALPSGPHALDGQVHVDADSVRLALAPAGERLQSTFTGTVNSVAVDGQAVPLPASALALPKASGGLVLAILVLFGAGAATFTVLAVRKKTDPALLVARAQAFFEVGQYRPALRVSRRILRVRPQDVDATTVAAMSLVRLGRPAEAKPLLERAAGSEHQGLLCMVEALVLYHQGDAALAAQRLQEGFNAYPSLQDEMAAVDLLDQLVLQAHSSPPSPRPSVQQAVSP